MLPNWRELAYCDGIFTEKLFDNATQKMHRIIVELPSKEEKNLKKSMFFKKLEEALEKCRSIVEINCLDIRYCSDQKYSSMGIFAEEQPHMRQLIDGLEIFLDFFPSMDIEIGGEDFSVFSTSKGSFLMLGPAGFINS